MLDKDTARVYHKKRQSYTAIISEKELPTHVVNVTDQWVSVSFLDDLLRKYLHYDFIVKEDNKIFLRTIMYWEYEEESENEIKSMIIGYHENGHIAMEQRDSKTGEIEERVSNDDVTRNWDLYPEFGDYLHLCKEER